VKLQRATTYTDDGLALLSALGELCRISKVSNLDRAVGAQQNVITLDISVHTMHRVNVLKTGESLLHGQCVSKAREREREREKAGEMIEYLTSNARNLLLGELDRLKLLEDLSQAAATHELHGDPQIVVNDERVKVARNVLVMTVLHDADLSHEQLHVVGAEWHLLDGHLKVGTAIGSNEHLARSTMKSSRVRE